MGALNVSQWNALPAGMSRLNNFHTPQGVASLAQSNYLGSYQVTCASVLLKP